MPTVKTVMRKTRLTGSCQEWFPVVRENLSAHGYQNITADEHALCLYADYDGNPACGCIFVTLVPSAVCNETNVNTVVTVNLGGTSLC